MVVVATTLSRSSARTVRLSESLYRRFPVVCLARLSHSVKRVQDDSPVFKVAKVSYGDGEVEITNLHTTQLLQTIFARDLFTLNLTSRQERRSTRPARRTLSAIMPRENWIVLSFGNVRAVVGLDYLYLFDAHLPVVQDLAHETSQLLRMSGDDPHELVFLEHVLRDTVDSFYRRLRLFDPIVDNFLDKVTNEVYSDTGVHQLVPLKDTLQSMEMQVKQSLDCLTGLLNDDDQMLDLLLTEQAVAAAQGKDVDFLRHEYVELLLGVYARQLADILLEVQYLLGRLQSKQEFVSLALASYRNRMIRMNVHIGISGVSLGMMTAAAGFYGMNVVNGLEASTTAFSAIVGMSSLASFVTAAGALNYLSGAAMQKRAAQRLDEIETLTGALSDIPALDYTLKSTIEQGISMDKATFRETLKNARQSKTLPEPEVELLFDCTYNLLVAYLSSRNR